jgi:hypothetical protein
LFFDSLDLLLGDAIDFLDRFLEIKLDVRVLFLKILIGILQFREETEGFTELFF